jgi:hypothetical protein
MFFNGTKIGLSQIRVFLRAFGFVQQGTIIDRMSYINDIQKQIYEHKMV